MMIWYLAGSYVKRGVALGVKLAFIPVSRKFVDGNRRSHGLGYNMME